MNYWLTSKNYKRHQRAINKTVRAINKKLEQDSLWNGRFVVRQIGSPERRRYSDGSGVELRVKLKFIDRATGRYYVGAHTVNEWRGIYGRGYRIWYLMNWLIIEHWNVWSEDLAQGDIDIWREYNKTTRKV